MSKEIYQANRKAAKEANKKTFQGSPCKRHGHTERYVSNNICVPCGRLYQQTPERKEYCASYNKQYYKHTHPNSKPMFRYLTDEERKDAERLARARYKATPLYRETQKQYRALPHVRLSKKLYRLMRDHGVSREQCYALMVAQSEKCPVCGEHLDLLATKKNQRVCLDHCHESGIVRGLLHSTCNVALGLLKDNPQSFRQAALYLETFR